MNFNSNDPFEILDLDEATTDKKIIKRAYKRMALKFHPDVLSTPQSSPQEKKAASDRFAKINWAYSQLSGRGQDNRTYNTKSTTKNNPSSGGWTPPHRRASGQGSNRSHASSASDSKQSVDWSDFIPKSDDSYDTNGDSFGKIFSDIFAGAATTAVSGAAGSTVFKDFIEFLEGNVDGYGGTTGSDDAELQYLLMRGTREEIRNELDDTKLVVDQLSKKMRGIETEIFSATSELSETAKYLEKIRLEEIIAELNARKKVVKGYLKKAEQRLLALQIRYKEIKTSKSQWEDIKQESASSSYSSTGYSSPTPQYSSSKERDPDASWKSEGFGSSRRAGRSSRRRPEAATENYNSSDPKPTDSNTFESNRSNVGSEKPWKTEGFSSSRRSRRQERDTQNQRSGRNDGDAYRTSQSSGIASAGSSNAAVPPHRRKASSSNPQDDSKKRLREIIVDEEFEKMKRELGL
ncbi:MAG: hypothetical protein SGBAC_003516 [Bacillariaceae sp.]